MRLKYGIAIAGTHGKTTTTSHGGHGAARGGPRSHRGGGRAHATGSAPTRGSGRASSWWPRPTSRTARSSSCRRPSPSSPPSTPSTSDHYADLDADRAPPSSPSSNKVPFYGAAVLCLDEPNIQRDDPADREAGRSRYGLESGADLTARRLAFAGLPAASSRCCSAAQSLGPAALQMPGRHNVLNALAAIAVGLDLEMPLRRHRGARARRLPRRPAPLPDPRRGPRRPRGGRLRPSPGRDPRHPRRRQGGLRPARDHGVPAAPLQPHPAPPAGVPHRVLPVGRPDRDGHLPGGRGADSGRARAAILPRASPPTAIGKCGT